jgi:hypothetical protein
MGRKPSCKARSSKGGRKALPSKCFLPLCSEVEERIRSRGSKNKKGLSNDDKMHLLKVSTVNEMKLSQEDVLYFEDLACLVCTSKEDRNLSIDASRELTWLLFVMFCARKQLPAKGGGGIEGIVCQVVQRIITGEENRYVRGGKNMTSENKRVKRAFGYTFDDHKTFAALDAKLAIVRRANYSSSSYSMCYEQQDSYSEAIIRSLPDCSSFVDVKQEEFVAPRYIPYIKQEPVYQRPSNNYQSFVPFVKTEPVHQEGHDDSKCSLFESETASISSEQDRDVFEKVVAHVSAINAKEEVEEEDYFPYSPMDVVLQNSQCVCCGIDEAIIDDHCSFCALQLFNLS